MATSTHLAEPTPSQHQNQHPAPPRNPIVFWHLLSLDAPCVAALWTWFLAAANHIRLPHSSICAMATAVWLLYVADRLLDARLLDARLLDACLLDARAIGLDRSGLSLRVAELEERHYFHHANRLRFTVGILIAVLAMAVLVPHLPVAATKLYLILGCILIVYLAVIHIGGNRQRATGTAHLLPKELAVGMIFSAACFIPTISRQPGLRLPLLPTAILFAIVCSLNCLFIFAWEHPAAHAFAHPATRLALRFLPAIALTVTIGSLLFCAEERASTWQIPAACAVSTALLQLLDRNRTLLARTSLRACADLCLLTPLLFLPLLRR